MRFNKFILSAFVLLVISMSLASALDLSISSKQIVSTILNDADEPAKFDFTVSNFDRDAEFEIFTYEKFEISPDSFSLNRGESKKLRIEFLPFEVMRENSGFIPVPIYFREVSGSETVKHQIVIELVEFGRSFEIAAKNINPDAEAIEISFYNVKNISYDQLDVTFSSTFIPNKQMSFSAMPFEKKTFEIAVDKEQLKKLVYGSYLVNAKIDYKNWSEEIYTTLNLIEKELVTSNTIKEGIIVRRLTLEKTNEGNTPVTAELDTRKSVISRLFTTFSIEPDKTERKGLYVYYSWKKELRPDETLSVKATTNWMFPFMLVILVLIIAGMSYLYFSTYITIKKSVKFVKTKSNDFALRVQLRIKAKKFVENVRIYERLPAMTKVHEKFFGEEPTKLDKERGRMQWDISRLAEGEERVYTYIMYSKMKILGKFELPQTTAVYDVLGKVHEAKSNKVFFVNEPRKKVEED